MRTFKDTAGRDWTISINVATVKRLRDVLQVDLMDVIEGDLLRRLYSDPILLVDVVYVLVKPQADELGVTDEQFGAAMGGDSIEFATKAMVEEIVDFFPNRRDRERAKKVLAMFDQTVLRAQDKMDLRLESPTFRKELDSLVENAGELSGGAQESPE